jgi:heme-degrading monooxygenase HmoA
MIARLWHGRTSLEKADEYLRFLLQRAVPDYKSTKGNRTVRILHRNGEEAAHFYILTTWDSRDAIEGFAGKDIEVAKYYPEDKNFLLEFEPKVQHFEILEF